MRFSLGKLAAFDCSVSYTGAPQRSPLNDARLLREMLRDIARVARLTILHEGYHRFTPFGITMAFILGESHVSVHTWPEKNAFAVDLYSCRDDYDERRVAAAIARHLPVRGITAHIAHRQTFSGRPQ